MPKEIKSYQCNLCKTQYYYKNVAQKCEESHEVILKTTSEYFKRESVIPDAIEVEFSDGSHATYRKNEPPTQPALG